MEYPIEQGRNKNERFIVPMIFVCGTGAAFLPEVVQAAPDKLHRQLTDQEQVELNELKRSSQLSQAIDRMPEGAIRAEGYRGDIEELKKKAKESVPLLYNFYEREKPLEYPNFYLNLFLKGARTYYGIPDEKTRTRYGYSLQEFEEYKQLIDSACEDILAMPVTRVDTERDATIPHYFIELDKSGVGGYVLYGGAPEEYFFPIGTIRSLNSYPYATYNPQTGVKEHFGIYSAIRQPVFEADDAELLKHLDIYSDDAPRVMRKALTIMIAIHELLHLIGFGHHPDEDHPMNARASFSRLSNAPVDTSLPKYSFPLLTKNGKTHYFHLPFGEIKNSSVGDLVFFLRIFAKQHKQHLEKKDKNKSTDKS